MNFYTTALNFFLQKMATPPKKQKVHFTKTKYDPQVLEQAIDAVKTKRLSLRAASKFYNIKLTTLSDKVKGKTPLVPSSRTLLTEDEEQRLVKYILEMAEVGFGQSTDDIRAKCKTILDLRGAKRDLPCYAWVYGFMKRHPELSLR